jgi:hypothetical protein
MAIRNPKLMASSVFMLLVGGFILFIYFKLGNGINIGYYNPDLVKGLTLLVGMVLILFSLLGIVVALISSPPK